MVRVLPVRFSTTTIEPDFLTSADYGWLRLLVEEIWRFAHARRGALDDFLREPLPFCAPDAKLQLAIETARRGWRSRIEAAIAPRKARVVLFEHGAQGGPHDLTIRNAARSVAVEPDALLGSLFADLPRERRLCPPEETPDAVELALQCNQRLVQRLLRRSSRVAIRIVGNARRVVTHLKRCGLICAIQSAPGGGQSLEISGPLAIFHRTLLYGNALAGLVPIMAWCNEWSLHADIHLGDSPRILELQTGAPIAPAREPALYDSKLEKRFATEFRKHLPGWHLIREPKPVQSGQSLIYPDFELIDRREPQNRWLLEIVGFWTAEYLERKLSSYREAGLERLILCVDAERHVAERDLPVAASVIRFERSVDVERVAEILGAVSEDPCD